MGTLITSSVPLEGTRAKAALAWLLEGGVACCNLAVNGYQVLKARKRTEKLQD